MVVGGIIGGEARTEIIVVGENRIEDLVVEVEEEENWTVGEVNDDNNLRKMSCPKMWGLNLGEGCM